MKIPKEYNEIYGGAFVECLAHLVNPNIKHNVRYIINPILRNDLPEIKDDAKTLYKNCTIIKNSKVRITQQNTKYDNCDLISEYNDTIEIKYVFSGKGTYYNTTMYYFYNELHYKSIRDFLLNYKYYDFLESKGLKPNRENSSPYNIEKAKQIINNKYLYQEIIQKERYIRELYRNYILDMLNNSPKDKLNFVKDMITKKSSNKNNPDYIVVFNYRTKQHDVIPTSYLTNKLHDAQISSVGSNSIIIEPSGKDSLKIPQLFIVTLAWQNGTGLCNPTIRVFLC